ISGGTATSSSGGSTSGDATTTSSTSSTSSSGSTWGGGRGGAADAFEPASLRELTVTDADARDGLITLPPDVATLRQSASQPGPQQQVLFFIASRTGMMVKRPAIGAEGFVLDHYDRAAIDRYLETVGTPLLRALEAHVPYAIFCDSLEVFQSDWTGDLLEQ